MHNATGYSKAQRAKMMVDDGELSEIRPWNQSPDHHLFPEQHRQYFADRGIDIDEHTITLDWGTHDALHFGGGPGKGGGWWNNTIMANLHAREAALLGTRRLSPAEILQEGQRMLQLSKLTDMAGSIHPYRSLKG